MSSSETSIFNMPPGLRMVLFIGITGISMILGGLISFSIFAALVHVPFSQIQSVMLKPEMATMTQFANALATTIAFGLPSILIAYVTKGQWNKVMGFVPVKSLEQIGWVALIALVGLFLSGSLGDLNEKIPIPASLKLQAQQLEEQYKKALMAMTQMKSVLDLLYAVIAVAVIPAILEEVYFRGTLQKIIGDWSGKPMVAIVVTAIIFSAFHFSYFGFLSRMSLGIVLGLIYQYTKTIWLPILMHFINNSIGIIALYFVRNNPQKIDKVLDGTLSFYWAFIAIILIYFLLKQLKNSTKNEGLENSF